jgi:integrase
MARTHFQAGSLYVSGKKVPTWYGRYRDYILVEGKTKPIYRNVPLGPVREFTKPQAKRLLAERLEGINAWNCRPRQLITFGQFADTWLGLAERDYRPSNWGTIRGHVENHLKPFFGGAQMISIDAMMVKRFVASLKRKNGRAAAVTTRRHIYSTLSVMWRAAVEWEIIDSEKPIRIKIARPHCAPRRILAQAEVRALLSCAPEPYRSAYQLMSERGAMSISEVCGLNVGDLELERPVVHIRRSFTHGRLGAPKARARERSITISDDLHGRLLKLCWGRKADTPLFENSAGGRWDQLNVLKRQLYPLCDELGIPRTGFHAFRHFSITTMGELGVPLKTAAAWAGHSDPSLTARIYMHARPEEDYGYGKKLAKILAHSEPSTEPKSTNARSVFVGSA